LEASLGKVHETLFQKQNKDKKGCELGSSGRAFAHYMQGPVQSTAVLLKTKNKAFPLWEEESQWPCIPMTKEPYHNLVLCCIPSLPKHLI
jgi:hypothetical protein